MSSFRRSTMNGSGSSSSSSKVNPKRDMRGMTAIRKSEASLRAERDTMMARVSKAETEASGLHRALKEAKERAAAAESDSRQEIADAQERVAKAVTEAEREVEQAKAEAGATLAAERTEMTKEHDRLEARLSVLQQITEMKGHDGVSGEALLEAKILAKNESDAATDALLDTMLTHMQEASERNRAVTNQMQVRPHSFFLSFFFFIYSFFLPSFLYFFLILII